ncbi:Maf-domain-containing protein [Melanomma pulvis-pyrius CBS 109.77]|uniref:Maf-domain-containing protein n=1 Tax=Melanomma pulvis-pyrius CBS 109.77 TaxID=1314802 RepID=A0A6A6XTQ8_9PLEO|nr:Maf-domain-containing protein [Melanomma pulvis-pyrius CBS 109.77]
MSKPTPSDPPPSYEAAAQRAAPSQEPLRSPRGPPPGPRKALPPPPPLNLPYLNLLRTQRVILASQSPRRRELLAQIGLTNVEIVPSTFAENLSKSISPFEYVLATAREKCSEVYSREIDNTAKGEPALVLAADTIIISHSGKILEKPRSEIDHIQMLQMLRDEGTHKVVTAVCAMAPMEAAIDPGYKQETHVEETTVKFDPNATDDLIIAYVKTRDGADKAGGYGVQTGGAILIERIEGSYDNVIGLPLRLTLQLIERVLVPEVDDDDGMDNMFNLSGDEDKD